MNNKKIISVIVVALLVIIAIILVVKFTKKDAATIKANEQAKITQNLKNNMAAIAKTDKDFDGLTDAEEVTLKTDPNNIDTDGDGLTDGDEVKLFKTNPLKADTYGLGMNDLDGVREGIILRDGKVNKK